MNNTIPSCKNWKNIYQVGKQYGQQSALQTENNELNNKIILDPGNEKNQQQDALFYAPGYKGFVTEMIDGAIQANITVLVISSRKSEFETGRDGQTREHAKLFKTIGAKYLVF